jgi:hypothetical protein
MLFAFAYSVLRLLLGRVVCHERLGGLLREYAREPLPAAA